MEKSYTWSTRLKYEEVKGQRTIFDLMDGKEKEEELCIDPVDEFQEFQLMSFEKQYLGMYLSKHPLNQYKNYYRCIMINKIVDIEKHINKKKVKLFGLFENVEEKTTKHGDIMAFADFTDITGSVQVIFFPKKYIEFKSFLEYNEPIFLNGVVEKDEKSSNIIPIDIHKKTSYFKKNKFDVVFYPEDEKELEKLHEFLLNLRTGNNCVIISIKNNNNIVDICIDKNIAIDDDFFEKTIKKDFRVRVFQK